MESRIRISSDLSPERWEEYRDLWLEALDENPGSFGPIDIKKESRKKEKHWRQEITKPVWKIFFAENVHTRQIVGIVKAELRQENDDEYGWIKHLFVKKDHEGQGIGRALLHEAIIYLTGNFDVYKIGLCVRNTQTRAKEMYIYSGFEPKEFFVDKYDKSIGYNKMFLSLA